MTGVTIAMAPAANGVVNALRFHLHRGFGVDERVLEGMIALSATAHCTHDGSSCRPKGPEMIYGFKENRTTPSSVLVYGAVVDQRLAVQPSNNARSVIFEQPTAIINQAASMLMRRSATHAALHEGVLKPQEGSILGIKRPLVRMPPDSNAC
ncbi:hypothetical protein CO678_39135 [Bradyrhizobium diazoefficiens]|nr:hypothetical protein CO678_39135 [Bradyrhizobium diazoefficiens]